MHPNPIYHSETPGRNLAWARERGFGILAVSAGDAAPMLAHVPFLLDEDGTEAHLHLVRSNPIARALAGGELAARIAVSGPDAYVSPDWYGVRDQVPTWNYIAVHLTGRLSLRPQEEMRALLDAQSAHFEDRLLPKTPWTTAKMTPESRDRMMRQIVPVRLIVEAVDGTWKMNQNKTDDVRLRAADGIEAFGIGSEARLLAALMRSL
ncbi:MAG: FMN-binding negative transcriptional regulator [Rhodobacteraceae bacterium]|nr:MAG: FMN-binding negative transcriptional regulator [Paracoccaceae bacterium]